MPYDITDAYVEIAQIKAVMEDLIKELEEKGVIKKVTKDEKK